jgi:acyl-CoA synthetase (AMP-forming)/AMP-acid ligase II
MIPTIGEMIAGSAARVPERQALVCDDQELSYRELNARVNQTVSGFLQHGMTGGDRAALLLHNRIELVVLLMGLARAGIVGIPLNYRLHPGELSAVLHQSGATLLFVGEELESVFNAIAPIPPAIRSVIRIEADPVKRSGFDKVCSSRPERNLPAMARPDCDSFIIYTSGTTGFPRGVVLTHGNHFWNAINYSVAYGMGEDDVELGLSPLFHSSTLGRLITCFFVGATFVTSRQFHPETAMQLITRNRVTSITQSPTMYAALSNLTGADRCDTASVKRVVSGAAPLFPALRKELSRLFPGAGVFDLYGLTEAAPGVSILMPQAPPEKMDSVGRPMISVRIKIVDDRGTEVPIGECGEILCRGPNVMKGYYNNEAATAEALKDGWLCTGDTGKIDEHGYLYLIGRKKEMIIRGGEKIYPADIERILHSHPGIAEAAVIGVPDAYWGERVEAFVVPRPGATLSGEEVIRHCRQHLAVYKIPSSVIFAHTLPKNAAGKVIKSLLKIGDGVDYVE